MKKVFNKKGNKILAIAVIVVVILLFIFSMISKLFGRFETMSLDKNKNTIFSITDLIVDDVKFGDTENTIINYLGNPKKIEKTTQGIFEYKVLYYDGLELYLKENYSNYILTKAVITSKKYKTSRNIRVKDSIKKVLNKYKVENSKGTYIYGNYTTDALSNSEITDNIYIGVRNDKEVVYINRDAIISNDKTNIARLNISYSFGKVSKITWSYDIE